MTRREVEYLIKLLTLVEALSTYVPILGFVKMGKVGDVTLTASDIARLLGRKNIPKKLLDVLVLVGILDRARDGPYTVYSLSRNFKWIIDMYDLVLENHEQEYKKSLRQARRLVKKLAELYQAKVSKDANKNKKQET